MTRCNSCNGVIAKNDAECYSCGERVPGAKVSRRAKRQSAGNAPASVMPIGDVLIIACLVLTAVCFFLQARIPVALSSALAGVLFTAKIVTDRRAAKRIQL